MTTTGSGNRRSRTGLVLAVAVAGVLGWPGAARAAGVTTTPTQAAQGDAVELALVVPEERPGARTEKIEFRLPADAPIGEVYPLSVPGWAPLMTSRTLDRPVAGIHAPGVTTVTASVVWTRAAGKPEPGPARLFLAMGPLPQTDRMSFEVVQTYSDGTVVRWADPAGGAHPAPTLTLLPAGPGAATGHGHGGPDTAGQAGNQVGAEVATAADSGARDGGPSDDVLLGGGLLIGLGGGALVGWAVSRGRHRADPGTDVETGRPDGEPSTDEQPEGERSLSHRPEAEPSLSDRAEGGRATDQRAAGGLAEPVASG